MDRARIVFDPITTEEAAQALTKAAWTPPIPEENYQEAVAEVRRLCAEVIAADSTEPASLLAADIQRSIGPILAEPERKIHSYLGGFGADWTLSRAVALLDRPGVRCGWAAYLADHDLLIEVGDNTFHFEARRPPRTAHAE